MLRSVIATSQSHISGTGVHGGTHPTLSSVMPTNLIKRKQVARDAAGRRGRPRDAGSIWLVLGATRLKLVLRDGETAARISAALPLFAVAEPWGASIHFEVPLVVGRERTARLNARIGEVYFWTEQSRVLIPFGPTPISRDGEVRLHSPCTPWADIAGDVKVLQGVRPGAKLTLTAE